VSYDVRWHLEGGGSSCQVLSLGVWTRRPQCFHAGEPEPCGRDVHIPRDASGRPPRPTIGLMGPIGQGGEVDGVNDDVNDGVNARSARLPPRGYPEAGASEIPGSQAGAWEPEKPEKA